MDTLAVCSAWALSLCALGKHDDAATFQATKLQPKSALLLLGPLLRLLLDVLPTNEGLHTDKLRSKVGSGHPRSMTELLA